MADWNDWSGRTQEQSDVLTTALLARFRATIDSNDRGHIAPQGIHWCLCLPDAATGELGEDGHPRKGGWLPPIPLPRRMWAGSRFRFLQPLRIGDTVSKVSTMARVDHKSGRTGELVFVTVRHVYSGTNGPGIEEEHDIVYREAAMPGALYSATAPSR